MVYIPVSIHNNEHRYELYEVLVQLTRTKYQVNIMRPNMCRLAERYCRGSLITDSNDYLGSLPSSRTQVPSAGAVPVCQYLLHRRCDHSGLVC